MVRVIINNISINGTSFIKERVRKNHQRKKIIFKVLSTIQPNFPENRPGNSARWPSSLAQHEFLQTLLIIELFLFTVKERC